MFRRRQPSLLKTDPHTLTPPSECVRCGYDLDGTDDDGACPECGVAARLSRIGTLLPMASEASLLDLERGARLLFRTAFAAAGAPVVLVLVGLALSAVGAIRDPDSLSLLLIAGAAAALALGWGVGWGRIARACDDPGLTETSLAARRAAFYAAGFVALGVCGLGGAAILFVVQRQSFADFLWRVLPPLVGVAWIVCAFAGLLLCRAIADRTNDLRFRRRARLLLWLTFVVSVCLIALLAPLARMRVNLTMLAAILLIAAAFLWGVFFIQQMSALELEAMRARRIRRGRAAAAPRAS